MEAIIFIGIQAVGKSSFFKARFFNSHIRINLDMLKTRHREGLLIQACLDGKQPFVIDNTNITVSERAKYITAAKEHGFKVVGYYFRSNLKDALERNKSRPELTRVPEKGLLGTYKKLQIPSLLEGFNCLYYVTIKENGDFSVEEWADEV